MSEMREYFEIVEEIKHLETKKKAIRERIIGQMRLAGEAKRADDGVQARLSRRQAVKYDLEGIEHELLSQGLPIERFCTYKPDLTKIEALIGSGEVDPSKIAEYAEVNESFSLSVKEGA